MQIFCLGKQTALTAVLNSKGCGHADGCKIKLATGETYIAKAVAYCNSPTVPVRPPWAQPKRCSSQEEQLPAQDPLIQHAADVRISEVCLRGKAVAVVGGGMTGAQLTLQATARGASSVTLITRHKLCVRALNCEARFCHQTYL